MFSAKKITYTSPVLTLFMFMSAVCAFFQSRSHSYFRKDKVKKIRLNNKYDLNYDKTLLED